MVQKAKFLAQFFRQSKNLRKFKFPAKNFERILQIEIFSQYPNVKKKID